MLISEDQLTPDQLSGIAAFTDFLLEPNEKYFVLKGYSGCGKSTLVAHLVDKIPNILKTANVLGIKVPKYTLELTATTNKAAESLSTATGMPATTIHSFLELRVQTEYSTGRTTLKPRNMIAKNDYILFIDEGSYVDTQLLSWIKKLTSNCKIIFVGDPGQLTPVMSSDTPAFNMPGVRSTVLSEVVRQAKGNPIIDLATKFRNTVETGQFFSFKPDGNVIQHLDRDSFNALLLKDMTDPNWKFNHSKLLAWTNKTVIAYNKYISEYANGDPHFQKGDYAVVNNFCTSTNGKSFKTDQLVQITDVSGDVVQRGVMGKMYTLDNTTQMFCPNFLEAKNLRIKKARNLDEYNVLREIDMHWVDLRQAHCCTVNKAQGSTYDRVFIDLDDICKCNSGDQIARMLYVAVSRARNNVYLTGDFV